MNHSLKELKDRYEACDNSKVGIIKLMREISKEAYEHGRKCTAGPCSTPTPPRSDILKELKMVLHENDVLVGKLNEYRNIILPTLVKRFT